MTVDMLQGFYDSIKGIALIFYIDNKIKQDKAKSNALNQSPQGVTSKDTPEPKIMYRVIQNCSVNGACTWLIMYLFKYMLFLPDNMLKYFSWGFIEILISVWRWFRSILLVLFKGLWQMPIFSLVSIVGNLWFSDIAEWACKYRIGKPQPLQSRAVVIMDTFFNILVQVLFLLQANLLYILPQASLLFFLPNYFGTVLYCVHISVLHSLYAFEYKWYNMGWELHKRLSFIECNWAYFIGFGMPLTILTSLSDDIIYRCCSFSLLFPLFILSANEARSTVTSFDYPLRLFSLVLALFNMSPLREIADDMTKQSRLKESRENLEHSIQDFTKFLSKQRGSLSDEMLE